MKAAEKQANRRIRLLLAAFVLVFAATLGRAVWLQGVHAASLGRIAERQHRESITVPAGRGTIFDRTGVQLAIGEQTTTVYADPRQVTQPRLLAVAAHRLFGVDANQLYAQLLARKSSFLYVQRFADPAKAAAFIKKGFAGVNSYPEEKRTYPQRTVGAQLVGYAGTDNKGLAGLEVEYDSRLSGRPGKRTIVRDPFGRAIDVISSTAERDGTNVVTTIDHTIQANAEAVLRQTIAKWHARAATAVVLDPRTGAVLAMAQAPGYDANAANRVPFALQRNRAVTDTYEPGSTFKLVTIAGALSEGIVTPGTTFRLPYSIPVADRIVHDAEPRGTETLSVAQILSHSSNVGAVTIAEETRRRLADGLDRPLRLRQADGHRLPRREPGPGAAARQVVRLDDRQRADRAGHRGDAHPDGGGLWRDRERRRVGRAASRPAHRRSRVSGVQASPRRRQAGQLRAEGDADERRRRARRDGQRGRDRRLHRRGQDRTAQKPGLNGYTTGKYVASFIGMVPVGRPRLVVLVTVDEPHGGIFGGVVAAPAFAQIAKFDLQYMGVTPDAPGLNARRRQGAQLFRRCNSTA